MANREISLQRFIRKNKIKQHKVLRQDPQFRQQKGKTKKELERILEVQDAEDQIKEYLK